MPSALTTIEDYTTTVSISRALHTRTHVAVFGEGIKRSSSTCVRVCVRVHDKRGFRTPEWTAAVPSARSHVVIIILTDGKTVNTLWVEMLF